MALEFLTDEHLGKVVQAAILLDEEDIEPTDDVISDKEVMHLPEIVTSLAAMRGWTWQNLEEGVRFLQFARELDEALFNCATEKEAEDVLHWRMSP